MGGAAVAYERGTPVQVLLKLQELVSSCNVYMSAAGPDAKFLLINKVLLVFFLFITVEPKIE